MTDDARIEMTRSDEHELLATITTMRPALSRVALRIVGNEDDAADVVQDSCLRAWRALPGFRGDSKLSTWLHAIVVNVSLSALQRRRQHPTDHLSDLDEARLPDPREQADPHAAAESTDLRHELLHAVDRLPRTLRDVVVARELRGMTHSQIATALGISEGASKVRLHRARLQMAVGLGHHLEDERLPRGA